MTTLSAKSTISFRPGQQLILLLLLAFGLNFNTLCNEYALDDAVVLTGNSLVQKGIHGIPEILTKEMFFGLDKAESNLSGGRYRPAALVIFAIEYHFFGCTPFISHLLNVLLFVLGIALLYKILQVYLFKDQHPYLAFLTCLLFVVHPVHTEVIANVKSRDELIAFVLLLITAFTIFWYIRDRKIIWILLGTLSYFLALLTRESAVPFIGIVPLVAYFFYNQSIKKSILMALPLLAVFILYMIVRVSVVGFSTSTDKDVLNSPFILATPSEAFATKMFLLVKYLVLLVFPYPLTFDYGFDQIPYVELLSVKFILSTLLILSLLVIAALGFRTRSMVSFSILFFMLTIFLFANFVIDIGAPLAERLLFQPSIAFCIVVALLYFKTVPKAKNAVKGVMVVLLLLCSVYTVARNRDWKNNDTLFFTDVETVPNSVRANLYAAKQYITKAKKDPDPAGKETNFRKAIYYDERILEIYPHCRFIYEDLGFAYFGINNYLKAADLWIKASILDPENKGTQKRKIMISDVLYNQGNNFYRNGNFQAAITYYEKAVAANPENTDAWYNLGGSYFRLKDTKNGLEAWQNVMRLDPERALDTELFSN